METKRQMEEGGDERERRRERTESHDDRRMEQPQRDDRHSNPADRNENRRYHRSNSRSQSRSPSPSRHHHREDNKDKMKKDRKRRRDEMSEDESNERGNEDRRHGSRREKQRRHDDNDRRHKRNQSKIDDKENSSTEDSNPKRSNDRHDERRRHRKKSDKRKSHTKKKSRRSRYSDGSDLTDDSSDRRDRRRKSSRKSDKHKKMKKEKKEGSKDSKSSKTIRANASFQKPDKKLLVKMGPVLGKAPSKLVDPQNDYYAFHQHLWVYLHREEGLAFNDLQSTEETREAFQRFAAKYNAGELEKEYYQEFLPAAVVHETKTTRHTWSFQLQDETAGGSYEGIETEEQDRNRLRAVEANVRRQTTNTTSNKTDPWNGRSSDRQERNAYNSTQPQQSHNVSRSFPNDSEARHTSDRRGQRVSRRERERMAQEELLPDGGGRREGRERSIEQRKERAARIHGAARDREDTMAMGRTLGDDDIYGKGDDKEKDAMLARERRRASEKHRNRESRITELQAKERQKQEDMLKKLGLSGSIQPGQKIKIAPRNDNPET